MVKVMRGVGCCRLTAVTTKLTSFQLSPHSVRVPLRGMDDVSKKRAIRALTLVQHGSASFIGIFLAIHLAAPMSAFVGGSEMSSRVMVHSCSYHM